MDRRDRIFVEDLRREAEIGAFEEERGRTQRLRFDVWAEPGGPAPGDDVDRVLSYDRLVEAVDGALAQGRVALLETLAEGIAGRVLRDAGAVGVRVAKLDRGPGALGVAIERRGRVASGPDARSAPPDVALAMPGGPLPAASGPLVLCPSGPAAPPPEAPGGAAARVALLALDQAAWVIGAAAGLAVVATRTEMEHALGRAGVAVWAPARMALDAGLAADPPALAAWLADLVGGRLA